MASANERLTKSELLTIAGDIPGNPVSGGMTKSQILAVIRKEREAYHEMAAEAGNARRHSDPDITKYPAAECNAWLRSRPRPPLWGEPDPRVLPAEP